MKEKTFLLHWLDGKTTEVHGYDIAHAFSMAGYGGGAIRALDYYEEKRQKSYVRNRRPTHD